MKKRRWFKQMLFSYGIVLYATIAIILFLFFFVISEVSFQGGKRANSVAATFVSDSIEHTLREAERVVLVQLEGNHALQNFFEPASSSNSRLINYEASREIRKILKDIPAIHSITLYRASDQSVLTQDQYQALPYFSDREFITQSIQSAPQGHWSEARVYPEYLNGGKNKKVISMVKKTPIPLGRQGAVVINVALDSLLSVVHDMIDPDIMFMSIYSGEQMVMQLSGSSFSGRQDILTNMELPYAGMQLQSGIIGGLFFEWVHAISRGWIALGAVTVLSSLIYLVYITRKNYRPVEQILRQMQTRVGKYESKEKEQDEFTYIGNVFDNVVDQNLSYEQQISKDQPVRRKQFFIELVSGDYSLAASEWQENLSKFHICSPEYSVETSPVCSVIVEIDEFRDVQARYSKQNLDALRCELTNLLQELFDPDHYVIWAEWIELNRLSVLLMGGPSSQTDQHVWEMLRTMIAQDLKLSVTIGIGSKADSWRGIPVSYTHAVQALTYKCSIGMDRVIRYDEQNEQQRADLSTYYAKVSTIVDEFRMLKQDWDVQLDEFFQKLKNDVLPEEEVRHLLVCLLRSIQRMADTMPEEIQENWQSAQTDLDEIMELETLDAMLPPLSSKLKGLLKFCIDIQQARTSHQLLSDIRSYIEEHYGSPDLSLDHIGDKFHINGKYFSQLFKQQFGMTFVEFLINLRMKHAKQMLLDTEESINEISIKVGYLHPISFGRAFKRATGVTPSEYRKRMYMPVVEEAVE